jgi:hypothetical protein
MTEQRELAIPDTLTFGEIRELGNYLTSAGASGLSVRTDPANQAIPLALTWQDGPSVVEVIARRPNLNPNHKRRSVHDQ